MRFEQLRNQYHQSIDESLLAAFRNGSTEQPYNDPLSGYLSSKMFRLLGLRPMDGQIPDPIADFSFANLTKAFLKSSFLSLPGICSDRWLFSTDGTIPLKRHKRVVELQRVFRTELTLRAMLEANGFTITPDILVGRAPKVKVRAKLAPSGDKDTKSTGESGLPEKVAHPDSSWILHAIISCKWTIRTDRAQNTRTEVLNLIRNRKGHLPHIAAVTAEPWPARIAALALGTGDLDCVYHFALPELVAAVEASANEDSREMLRMMIEGKRLRDISDLPFDLAV